MRRTKTAEADLDNCPRCYQAILVRIGLPFTLSHFFRNKTKLCTPCPAQGVYGISEENVQAQRSLHPVFCPESSETGSVKTRLELFPEVPNV
jgi:hypothetical protein